MCNLTEQNVNQINASTQLHAAKYFNNRKSDLEFENTEY